MVREFSTPARGFKVYLSSRTYTWGVSKPTLSDQLGLKFAPMLWGGDGGRIAAFQSVVKPGYGNAILGFNE